MRLAKTRFWLILSTVALAPASVSTYADGLPPATIFASVAGGGSISVPGTVTGSGCLPEGACQTSSVTVSYSGGRASIFSDASVFCGVCEPPDVPGTQSEAEVGFSFSVVGSKSESVPLFFIGSGIADVFTGGNATGSVFASFPGGNFGACESGAPSGTCGTLPLEFDFFSSFDAIPNTIYQAGVSAFAEGLQFPEDSWHSFSDLTVRIDPNFVDAKDFTLEFSQVPEPGSLLLLGTGLLVLVGFSLKRVVA